MSTSFLCSQHWSYMRHEAETNEKTRDQSILLTTSVACTMCIALLAGWQVNTSDDCKFTEKNESPRRSLDKPWRHGSHNGE
jgi:hypothetical protein